ncbi:MAG: type II secretion system ATPase GspE [Alphaproteobacteria bacterium]|nr:type II secretion system ATPase GspE [Alphaproteobacteria bacterium]
MSAEFDATEPVEPTVSGGSEAFLDTLAEALIAGGKLQAPALARARRVSEETGERLDAALTKLGLVSDKDLAQAMAQTAGLERARDSDFPQAPVFEAELSARFLRQAGVVPLAEDAERAVVAVADPLDTFVIDALRLATERPVELRIATPAQIETALDRLYGDANAIEVLARDAGEGAAGQADADVERLRDQASEAPVIRLVNLLIERAVEQGASDVHLEPFEGRLRVRYRVDGVLREVEAPPARLTQAVISRVKIMARLNIAERRLPQDGRIRLATRGREIDLRVSTAPAVHGESVVLRVLDREGVSLDFGSLGFAEDAAERYLQLLDNPHGVLLLTGPTGSGKTTTLYASLLRLNTDERKILTVEDPVEYQLDGIVQVQVKPEIELTFASALRSFLRQDPDIMMVGEIRDLETAQIAVQAALTGHLVLSTLHTNEAAGAVTRLLEMGVPDYLLSSTLNGVAAQRLVRRLCPDCREGYAPDGKLVRRLKMDKLLPGGAPKSLYRAAGCASCGGTGYRGRLGVIEVLVMSDEIRQLILSQPDALAIERMARQQGMRSLYEDALAKAAAGATSIEEVLRTTRSA